jgi:hypothetical protein
MSFCDILPATQKIATSAIDLPRLLRYLQWGKMTVPSKSDKQGETDMNRKGLAGLKASATAVAIAALIVAPSVRADTSQIRTPVRFVLSGCSMLPAGVNVSGTGESFLVVNTRVDHNGVAYIERNDLVTGSATDSNGATYGFNYHNHASLQIPLAGFPFTAETTDHFNLTGSGQANQLQVHFVVRLTFYSPSNFTAQFINVHGNPMTCDPI